MAKRKRYTVQERQSSLIVSANAVLLERAGGEISYTQGEYAAIRATRGEYVVTCEPDKSGPGEPVIRVRLEADAANGSMPVS